MIPARMVGLADRANGVKALSVMVGPSRAAVREPGLPAVSRIVVFPGGSDSRIRIVRDGPAGADDGAPPDDALIPRADPPDSVADSVPVRVAEAGLTTLSLPAAQVIASGSRTAARSASS